MLWSLAFALLLRLAAVAAADVDESVDAVVRKLPAGSQEALAEHAASVREMTHTICELTSQAQRACAHARTHALVPAASPYVARPPHPPPPSGASCARRVTQSESTTRTGTAS